MQTCSNYIIRRLLLTLSVALLCTFPETEGADANSNALCPPGYYNQPRNSSDGQLSISGVPGLIKSILTPVRPICKLCDERCRYCTAAGFHIDVCTCKYFQLGDQCQEACPFPETYPDNDKKTCVYCAEACLGCTGPTPSECITCKNYRLYPNGEPGSIFNCTIKCPLDYPSPIVEEGKEAYCGPAPPKASKLPLILSVIGILALLVVGFLAGMYYFKMRYKNKKPQDEGAENPENEPLYPPLNITDIKPNLRKLHLIKEEDVRRDIVLGSGAYGTVYRGIWMIHEDKVKIPVAIKVLKGVPGMGAGGGARQSKDFVEEAFIMAAIEHPHLLKLLAVCLSSEPMLVTQLMPLGSLRNYLIKNENNIGSQSMLNWCTQISQGMEYLESARLVHRDLAARNVLVETPTKVKITDFGLARLLDVDEQEYIAKRELLPVKWLAVECLTDGTFSHMSDVWAFGVTVWEILTCGKMPYENVHPRDVPELLLRGQRLEQPPVCTLNLYMTLIKTWMLDPSARPKFTELVEEFSKMAQDPGRYIVIQGDELMRLPAYTPQDERALIRSLATKMDHADEIVNANEYFGLRGSSARATENVYVVGEDGYLVANQQEGQDDYLELRQPVIKSPNQEDVNEANEDIQYEQPGTSNQAEPFYVNTGREAEETPLKEDKYLETNM